MPNGLERLEEQVKTLRHRLDALGELVEGREPWSHRSRLHALAADAVAAKLAKATLEQAEHERERASAFTFSRRTKLIAVLLAIAALVDPLDLYLRLSG